MRQQTMRNDPMGRTSDVIDDAVRAARKSTAGPSDVASNFQRAVDKSLSGQPMTTLAMAAAVGFVLGAIWKA
jgi:ElaB/YqjD/DUF883 family membrane-anchored ribosome-binding protein